MTDSEPINDPFVLSLKAFLDDDDNEYTAAGISTAAGLNNAAIRHMLSGKSKSPKLGTILRICEVIEKTLPEMLGMSGAGYPTIPRYDAALSAGHGTVNVNQSKILDRIPFTPDFLKNKLARSNTDGLICCDAEGESMEPKISDGDLLIIDTNRKYSKPGIYAVNFGDDALVKRIEKVGPGYNLMSDHTSYSPMTVHGTDIDQLQFIGKVVWVGRVIR